MKSRLLRSALTCLLFSGIVTPQANGALIDFESLEIINDLENWVGSYVVEDGFVVANYSGTSLSVYGTEHQYYAGSTAIYMPNVGSSIRIERTDGNPFNLVSIDLAEFSTDYLTPVVHITGFVSGVAIHEYVTLDGAGPGNGLETFDFSTFNSVTEIRISSGSSVTYDRFQLDNVVLSDVSAVPVPAAAWLFGSGLLGMIGIARKKNAA
jgi:hypothetical protein